MLAKANAETARAELLATAGLPEGEHAGSISATVAAALARAASCVASASQEASVAGQPGTGGDRGAEAEAPPQLRQRAGGGGATIQPPDARPSDRRPHMDRFSRRPCEGRPRR